MIDNAAFTIKLFGFTRSIYWYGIIIAMAMLIGIWTATYNARRRGFKGEMVLDLAIIAVVFAVVGARIHYVIFSWEFYKDGPFIEVFKIWNGGLAIYGGLIGGLLGTFLYCKFTKRKFMAIVDILMPSLILGQSIGRWGNFANQEAFGWQVTNPAWTFFPASVFIEATRTFHLATFFYESMWTLAVFIFLMIYMKKDRRQGNVFYLYFLLYGIGRVFIEPLRMDSQMLFGTAIRVNQLISAILIVFGALMLIFRKSNIIAKVYPARLFPFIKKKEKKEEIKDFDILKVDNDLKLMDDESRLKRVNDKKTQESKEIKAKKEEAGSEPK